MNHRLLNNNNNSDDGWLTLCGLDWLQVGENKVGSDESCSVRLPAPWLGTSDPWHGHMTHSPVTVNNSPSNAATLVLNADETIQLIPAHGMTTPMNHSIAVSESFTDTGQ
jgi:hypothetical protein